MKITDYFSEDLVAVGLKPADKHEMCEKMVALLIDKGKISEDRRSILLEKLMEREALSSTGIGGGVAIPHASGENIDNTLVAVGQAPEGVDFDAIDDAPVKLVFMIVGSDRSPREHLQLLASIVRILKNKELVNKLLMTGSAKEVFDLIDSFCNG